MSAARPVLGFIGIHSGGRTDQATSQDEILASLFEADGFDVRAASSFAALVPRSLDQAWAAATWDVDVLVIAVFSGRSFFVAQLASLLGRQIGHRRVVLFLHGGNLPVFAPRHSRRVRRTLDRADLIAAPSSYLADAFGGWGYDVTIIPNVVDLDDHPPLGRSAARPALLWMRTFHEDYNPIMAVEVLARVVATHPDATMTMGGADHGMAEATQRRAQDLELDGSIHFPGYLDRDGKERAFAAHDIFVNTNRIDNTPVSVIEAAASGLVPVSTDVGGISSLLRDETDSVLVPPDDAEAMATAVLDLIADPARYRRLSACASERAQASGWPAVKQRWLDVLGPLLDASSSV